MQGCSHSRSFKSCICSRITRRGLHRYYIRWRSAPAGNSICLSATRVRVTRGPDRRCLGRCVFHGAQCSARGKCSIHSAVHAGKPSRYGAKPYTDNTRYLCTRPSATGLAPEPASIDSELDGESMAIWSSIVWHRRCCIRIGVRFGFVGGEVRGLEPRDELRVRTTPARARAPTKSSNSTSEDTDVCTFNISNTHKKGDLEERYSEV
ncbi:hypothetical protein BDV96DRAFT_163829 [Lophiotrema nucula]|uniref:Uncharacterized protein n=1 Tax=Lophiotrema nucula TaxID=690887 RepID=A0A6A5Z2C7_9PLEO|nr:hypothetical protein BDV96DRAFT_163829 [Lophiotrema nucula]